MDKKCNGCGKLFSKTAYCSLKYWNSRKNCSRKCFGISRRGIKTWSSTQKGIHLSPSSEFKKGMTPWNKGVPMRASTKSKISVALSGKRNSIKSEFTTENSSGVKNSNWKGDSIGNSGVHTWIITQKGNPEKCANCGKLGSYYEYTRGGKTINRWTIDLANIDHSYKRNIDDFIGLCVKCHRKYDMEHNNYDSHPLN